MTRATVVRAASERHRYGEYHGQRSERCPGELCSRAQTVDESSPLVFSAANGNQIAISDPDAGSSSVQVTLTATQGKLTLGNLNGLSFSTGDGTSDTTMVFQGTITNVNAALNGLTFLPTTGYDGAATVQIVTSDLGNTGSGGAKSDTDTVNITVDPVNDAPTNSVPGPQSINENTSLVFSTANSNLISINDPDPGNNPMQVTLTVTNGTITLGSTSGLSFVWGDGTNDTTMSFTGHLAQLNAALDGLTFTPTTNFNGAASLQIATDDQANGGAGGAMTDTDTIAITVNHINVAPVNTVPAAQNVNEDTALVFSAAGGNAISISDSDAGSGSVQVTLTGTNGVVTLSGISGLTFNSGDGTGDATMTFTGTIANINSALNGLSFSPTAGYSGAASLQIVTNDQGNLGTGGAKSDTDTVNITVAPVNDAPVNSVPGPQSVNEDATLVFSTAGGNAISVGDVDAGSSPFKSRLRPLMAR